MCRCRRDDAEMARFARSPESDWYVGRGTGRGAWICLDGSCFNDLRAGQLSRALHAVVLESEVGDLRAAGIRVGFK